MTLPYIPNLSENIQKLCKDQNITVAHKGYNLLNKNFSKLKNNIDKNTKSNVIYQIPCNDCNGVYIGQTSQYLKNRIKGHKYDKKNKTALTNHAYEQQHTFDFENTRILHTETNIKKREFLEMVYIQKNKNCVNLKTDTKNLSKIYFNLIN